MQKNLVTVLHKCLLQNFIKTKHFEESRNLIDQKYFDPYLKNQIFPTFGSSAVTLQIT